MRSQPQSSGANQHPSHLSALLQQQRAAGRLPSGASSRSPSTSRRRAAACSRRSSKQRGRRQHQRSDRRASSRLMRRLPTPLTLLRQRGAARRSEPAVRLLWQLGLLLRTLLQQHQQARR